MKPIRETETAVRAQLERVGFRKRSGWIFTVSMAPDVLGWLGLNRAVGRPEPVLEVNPVVGIRHQQIERELAILLGEGFHPYVPPTVSSNLGYLMPEGRYRAWLFDAANASGTASDMASAIERYGVPFMRSSSALPALVEAMTSGNLGVQDQLAYRVPIAYRLMGNHTAARQTLEDAIAKLGGRADAAAERFREFGRAFVRTM
jgi:hypothetical protein